MKQVCTAMMLWLLVLPAWAQAPAMPPTAEDWEALRRQGVELHEQAKKMRAAAAARHAEAERTCPDELFAATCMDDATKKRSEEDRVAKRIERESRDIERRVKAHDREVKAAQRAAEAPKREAEAARHAEKNRKEQEDARRRVERKQAEDAARQQGRR